MDVDCVIVLGSFPAVGVEEKDVLFFGNTCNLLVGWRKNVSKPNLLRNLILVVAADLTMPAVFSYSIVHRFFVWVYSSGLGAISQCFLYVLLPKRTPQSYPLLGTCHVASSSHLASMVPVPVQAATHPTASRGNG